MIFRLTDVEEVVVMRNCEGVYLAPSRSILSGSQQGVHGTIMDYGGAMETN